MGRLIVVEYMPPVLKWGKRFIKLLVIGCSLIVVIAFWHQMKQISEKRLQFAAQEKKFAAYEAYLQQGRQYLEEEKYMESEECCRSAIELLPKAEAPYLTFAEVLCRIREYGEAVRVLEAYQGKESVEIKTKLKELLEKIEILEQSVFK